MPFNVMVDVPEISAVAVRATIAFRTGAEVFSTNLVISSLGARQYPAPGERIFMDTLPVTESAYTFKVDGIDGASEIVTINGSPPSGLEI